MPKIERYNPVERQHQKQRARKQDERDLRDGVISPEALNRRNGFFSRIDLSNASVRLRGQDARKKTES
jgi:hypothetical protein